jgi:hypothetical protein
MFRGFMEPIRIEHRADSERTEAVGNFEMERTSDGKITWELAF